MLQKLTVSSSGLDFSNSNYNYDNANANVGIHLCNNCSINPASKAKNRFNKKSTGNRHPAMKVIFSKQRGK